MIRKKHLVLLFSLCSTLFLCSCGHNVLTTTKGVGVDISWSGESYIPNLRLGYWDAVSAIPRGNASVSTTTATGGILGNGGTSQTTMLTAGTQLNEGNIVKICTSQHSSNQVKIAALQSITQLNHPGQTDGTAKTISAAAGIGPKSVQIRPITTGVDKAIQVVGDNADKIADVTKTTVNKVGDVAETTVQTTGSAATSAVDATKELGIFAINSVKLVLLIALGVVAILAIIAGVIYFRYIRKKKLAETANTSTQENQSVAVETNKTVETKTEVAADTKTSVDTNVAVADKVQNQSVNTESTQSEVPTETK